MISSFPCFTSRFSNKALDPFSRVTIILYVCFVKPSFAVTVIKNSFSSVVDSTTMLPLLIVALSSWGVAKTSLEERTFLSFGTVM